MVYEIQTSAHKNQCRALKPVLSSHGPSTEERPACEVGPTILFMSLVDQKK